MNYPSSVIGDLLGVAFPTSVESLLEQGENFLTKAFHASGALAADNRVVGITSHKENFLGGMGRKLQLSIIYERNDPSLHKNLFVKFPRDFGDPLRERYTQVMNPEVRFALMSRQAGFPTTVPKCYFADYSSETESSILITEQVLYGENGIEACHEKCMDYEMENPFPYYSALTRALARLAGHHKSGQLGEEADCEFPFNPEQIPSTWIPFDQKELQTKLETLQAFATAVPQIFPEQLRGNFLVRFAEEAPLVLQHEALIRKYLSSKTDYIALCHWNVNLDNAWFWKDEAGCLQAGLLDWGGVCQMNLGQSFYGMTSAGELDFINEHRRGLMALFIEEYQQSGGPKLDIDEFASLTKLAVALLGISWLIDGAWIVEAEIPEIHKVRDRFDPMLTDNFMARGTFHIMLTFLNEWYEEDIGGAVSLLVEKLALTDGIDESS